MTKVLALVPLVLLIFLFAACGNGVSDEEFEKERQESQALSSQLQGEQTKVLDLEDRLAKSQVLSSQLQGEQTKVLDLEDRLAKALATPEPAGPLAVLEANIAALNAGDVRELAVTYDDDVVFSIGPLPGEEFDSQTGLAAVLAGDLESIEHNQRITLSNTSVEGNTVRGEVSITDDESQQLGFTLNSTFEAVIEDGRIKSVTATLTEESLAQLQALFGPPPGPPLQAGEVIFTAFDTQDGHRYKGPDTLAASWTSIRLDNQSEEPHHLQLIKLAEGMTVEDLVAAFQQPAPPPPGLKFHGGPGTLFAAGEGVATVNLEVGSYALLCFVPGERGVPHFVQGMWTSLTVTADEGPPAPEPEAVATVDVSESGYTLSVPVPAGVQTIRITNSGQQSHATELVQLAPGASAQQFVASLLGPGGGLPPGKLLGGLGAIDPGVQGYFTALFEPGNYAVFGFESGAAHEFTVQ